jgi:putative phage-type endonuclease
LKLGLITQDVTPAMQRGTDLEPVARAAYEQQTGRVMQPLVVVDGEYSASIDGMTLRGERIVEIKCPVKGRDSTLWKTVEAGRLPEHYQSQVQHQLLVTGAAIADVFVFDGAEGVLLEIPPAPDTWPRIRSAWDEFMRCVTEAQAPPLTDRDTRIRDDPDWLYAAAKYLELRAAHDELSASLDEAKGQLIAQASHAKEQGGGVSVARYWKMGAIDYRKVPELAGVDLEQYRGSEREETRITVLK